jgi:hypothetical protein
MNGKIFFFFFLASDSKGNRAGKEEFALLAKKYIYSEKITTCPFQKFVVQTHLFPREDLKQLATKYLTSWNQKLMT